MRLLALDGGGVRGVVSAAILQQLEGLLADTLQRHVDRLAGTSVGSILACGISSGLSGRDALGVMRKLAPAVFRGRWRRWASRLRRLPAEGLSAPRHDAQGLHRALWEVFDPGLRFGDLPIPVDVPAYDVRRGCAWLFSSDREPEAEIPVWEVCAASSAAPGYFPAHVLRVGEEELALVDGGLGANLPAAVSIARAIELGRAPGPAAIRCVSVGTGTAGFQVGIRDSASRGALEWAPDAVAAFMGASSSVHHHLARRLLPPGAFHRIQVRLASGLMAMDRGDPAHLERLVSVTEASLGHGRLRQAAAALA